MTSKSASFKIFALLSLNLQFNTLFKMKRAGLFLIEQTGVYFYICFEILCAPSLRIKFDEITKKNPFDKIANIRCWADHTEAKALLTGDTFSMVHQLQIYQKLAPNISKPWYCSSARRNLMKKHETNFRIFLPLCVKCHCVHFLTTLNLIKAVITQYFSLVSMKTKLQVQSSKI